jgi:NAD(P)-dependent dehydrogenase (short-subunit alcohol dehydrogenase family)
MSQQPVIVVVGASGGIGTELCKILHGSGVRLVIGGRDENNLKTTAASFDSPYLAGDAKDFKYTEALFKLASDKWGQVNGAVNLAGSILLKAAHQTSDAEFRETLEQNLFTAFNLVKSAIPHLRKEGGSIVLVSSVAAKLGLANHEAIAAAKAGVEGLTLSAAATYAPYKIRVNAVAPGLVKTALSHKLTANEMVLKASTQMHPLQRVGEPRDVASAIRWFLAPEQSWVTGQILGVDGGLGSVKSNRG